MSNVVKFSIVGAAIVLTIALAVILFRGHGPANPSPSAQAVSTTTGVAAPNTNAPTATDKVSQADHDAFIASAIPSCQKTAAQNPKIMSMGLAPDAIEKYCRCVAQKSADVITQNELTYIAEQRMLPASFETKTRDIAAGCGAENLKPAQ